MSILHDQTEELPIPSMERDLLETLFDDGAALRETWITPFGLARERGVSVGTIRNGLRWLSVNGHLTLTVIDDGAIVKLTELGRSKVSKPLPDRVSFTGEVVDGEGMGQHFVGLAGYRRQFRARLGYEPFHGTLNVDLESGSITPLEDLPAIPIEKWERDSKTYGGAACYPATITTESDNIHRIAHVLVPDRTDHDERTVELVAPTKLRNDVDIETGNRVTVDV